MAPINPLLKNLGVVGLASVMAQVLPLLTVPWLTRLYGPPAFGVYGLFFATAMTLSLVASGRYEMGVPVVADDAEAARLLIGSLVVLGAFTFAASLLLAGMWVVFRISYSTWPVWLGAVYVLTAGTMQSLSCWLTRKGQFNALSAIRLVQATATSIGCVAMGYVTSQPWGLALGAVMGQALGALVASGITLRPVGNAWRAGTANSIKSTLVDHMDFPRVNAPHALLDGVRESGFQAGFAWMFGSTANGLYALSARVLRFPASIVAGSLGQVLFGRLAKDAREGSDSRVLVWRVAIGVGLVSAPVFVGIAISGPALFAWVFGEGWRASGQYAQIMAPALWLGLAIAPLTSIPVVAGRLRTAFTFALLDLAVRGVALGVGQVSGREDLALGTLTVGSIILCCAIFFWYLSLVARQRRRKVVFIGQTRWSRVLAENLSLLPDAREHNSYVVVGLDRPWSVLRFSNFNNLIGADLLVRVGFRPAGDTQYGRAFTVAWAFLKALRPKTKVIMYWIGTDVSKSKEMLERGRNIVQFSRAVGSEKHLAASPNLVEELRKLNVPATVMWFPGLTLRAPEKVPPMPTRFTVFSYVPEARPDFYGGPALVALAKAMPGIDIRIAGGDGKWLAEKPANLKFLGWVRNMDVEYAGSTVVVRLVEHDALGATAIEGLLFGRYVIYSGELQDSNYAAMGDISALIAQVAALYRDFLDGHLSPRQEVADRARRVFDQQSRLIALWTYLEECR